MTRQVLVINGPNLNLLGTREPEIYGTTTLDELNTLCHEVASELDVIVTCFQSNLEGELINQIQNSIGCVDGILINPAGYGHSSVAIRDALVMCTCPVIEVHLSNLAQRESFRQITLTGGVVTGQVSGLGKLGYRIGLIGLVDLIGGGKQT
jgi:3-dehydroquinate dehydratase-2